MLSEFRDKFQKRVTCVAFSIQLAKTNSKIAENSEICESLKLFINIHYYSFVSLVVGRNKFRPGRPVQGARAGALRLREVRGPEGGARRPDRRASMMLETRARPE